MSRHELPPPPPGGTAHIYTSVQPAPHASAGMTPGTSLPTEAAPTPLPGAAMGLLITAGLL